MLQRKSCIPARRVWIQCRTASYIMNVPVPIQAPRQMVGRDGGTGAQGTLSRSKLLRSRPTTLAPTQSGFDTACRWATAKRGAHTAVTGSIISCAAPWRTTP